MMRYDRQGVALPFVLVVMIFLTVGVATAFTRVQSEVHQDHDRQVRADAFAYAESGLEQFAANRVQLGFTAVPPAASESTRFAMQGGYADVILRRVRQKTPTASAVYLLRSRGVRQGGSTAIAGNATYTVTQYGFYRETEMQVLSAWTSLSGLVKNGTAGTISGVDNCAVAPDVAGVALPDGTYIQSGGTSLPTGTPPISYLGNQTQANDSVSIDWDAIVNQNLIWPDLVYPTDPWPNFAANPNYYPVIRVDGDLDLPNDGQGLLIVTGNVNINGSLKFKGIMLVGGTIYADGNNNVLGAVVSGLNAKLGDIVPPSDIGNGTKTYRYDSCEIAKTLNHISVIVLMGKTWSDTWPSY